jgi:hypothetical protein
MLSELKALYSISKYSLKPQIPQIKKDRIDDTTNENQISLPDKTNGKKSTEQSLLQELKIILSKYSDLIFIIFAASVVISLVYIIMHWDSIHTLEIFILFMVVTATGLCEYAISNDEDFMSRVNEDELIITSDDKHLEAINQSFSMNIAGNLDEESCGEK